MTPQVMYWSVNTTSVYSFYDKCLEEDDIMSREYVDDMFAELVNHRCRSRSTCA